MFKYKYNFSNIYTLFFENGVHLTKIKEVTETVKILP